MWVVTIHENKQSLRNELLDGLMGTKSNYEQFVGRSHAKYTNCYGLRTAIVFKTEGGAARLVNHFNNAVNSNDTSPRSKYFFIKDMHLSYRMLSKEEWNKLMDDKEQYMKAVHKQELERLQTERCAYK